MNPNCHESKLPCILVLWGSDLIFLTMKFFGGFLKVSPTKRVNFHVKEIQKQFGDILLIFRGCTTESKFYISIYYRYILYDNVTIKNLIFLTTKFFGIFEGLTL